MPSGVYKHKSNQGFQKGNTIWLGKKLSEKTKEKISKSRKGQTSHAKGRTYKDIYGDNWKQQIEKRRLARIKHFDQKGRAFSRPKHCHYQYSNFTKKVF